MKPADSPNFSFFDMKPNNVQQMDTQAIEADIEKINMMLNASPNNIIEAKRATY